MPSEAPVTRAPPQEALRADVERSAPSRVNRSSPPLFYLFRALSESLFLWFLHNTLPLTTADIALLYDDFALGRSIVPPQASCVRPTLVRWDPRELLSLGNCVVAEFKEAERAVGSVFATPQFGEERDDGIPTDGLPPHDLVDALTPHSFVFRLFTSPEELWGVEATRIAQARPFREWTMH